MSEKARDFPTVEGWEQLNEIKVGSEVMVGETKYRVVEALDDIVYWEETTRSMEHIRNRYPGRDVPLKRVTLRKIEGPDERETILTNTLASDAAFKINQILKL